ncbi:MAG: hypothetical protein NWT08_09890 [Akkermansiaceae bacterium]|jgi:hypothetical protein|nr:hypothetical protein [Akkermansiaceae bacterium]MDP4722339.1 hypothetical protein [Akkermansiaceae bacterium]MDP4997072.1 hypothetical protein [Akkermansiaceae bacterium]
MPGEQPFQLLFETFGKLPDCHAPSVNGAALVELRSLLDAPIEAPGHCILFKAPRAGHGKTHLLTRLQYELGGSHEFIPVHATGGRGITPASVLDDTLRRLVRSLPAAGGLTVLDLIARRLFSSALQPLVRSGEVPCQDREAALNALRTRPVETFDFHHPSAVTAHWAKENFELLGPRLALELSQSNGLPHRETAFWVDAMFHFASTPIDNPVRVRTLSGTVFEDQAAELAAHQRLVSLLGLMGTMLRVVLVADELEGFSSDETAALSFASFVGALRQSVDRLEIILSVNQDIWESAFLPRLSGGLADRLSEVTVELKPLDLDGMIALIESRAPGKGEEILGEFDAKSVPSHARGLIKEAAEKVVNKDLLSSDNEALTSIPTDLPDPKQWPKEQLPEPPKEQIISSPPAPPPFQPAPEPEAAKPWPEPVITPTAKEPETPKPEPVPEPEPVETGFSPEAAIAAFSKFRKEESPEEDSGGFLPPSEPFATNPAPEDITPVSAPVYEEAPPKPFSAPPVEPVKPEEPITPNPFMAAPTASVYSQPPQPEAPPTAQPPQPFGTNAPAPIQPQENPFQAPAPMETPVQAFQAAPPAPEPPAPVQQAPSPAPEPPAPAPEQQEVKTDRVDDLLKQFRERYGKS